MIKLTPSQWEKETGITIIDPDGWDRGSNFQKDWSKSITLDTFIDKAQVSTSSAWPQFAMHVWKQQVLQRLTNPTIRKVTIELTDEQVRELSTVITHLTGNLQNKAMLNKSGIYDEDWGFWSGVSKAVSKSFGFEAYCDPTSDLAQSLLGE